MASKMEGTTILGSSSMLSRYTNYANIFIEICNKFFNVHGANKLEKRIQVEMKFLKTLQFKDTDTQERHLKSSNLNHYAGILHAARNSSKLCKILCAFPIPNKDGRLIVDLVTNDGYCWVKVIARKSQALHLIWAGQGQFGERDLVKQAAEYLQCARCHPMNYISPKVHFAFYNGITLQMADALEKMGIVVWGKRVEVEEETEQKLLELNMDFSDESDNDEFGDDADPGKSIDTEGFELNNTSDNENCDQLCRKASPCSTEAASFQSENEFDILSLCELLQSAPDYTVLVGERQSEQHVVKTDKLNLDITTLITLVSSVCHGGCHFVFEEKILSQQASEERENPCLQPLLNYTSGKKLYACQTAVDDFNKILETLGGQDECERAKKLLQTVNIIEDQPSERAKDLPETGKIKSRSKVIFGTGDKIRAITTTANSGFVRAAEHQGVEFAAYLHPSRALTQQKEKNAKIIK